ncbi:MAG: MFS transporter [Pseudomonadota bacterium]
MASIGSTVEAAATAPNPQGKPPTLSRGTLAAYGAPAMPLSMVTLPIAVYLPAVYADPDGFNLGLGFVGLVLVLSRVFDGITDPVIGFLSDRTRTRWGRRKPFFLLGTPFFVAGVLLLWIPPIDFREVTWLGLAFNIGYPYLLGVLVLMYVGATIKDVPYSAWGAELSTSYHERSVVMGWKESFTVAGNLIGAMTPAIIFFWGLSKPVDVVFVLGILVAVMMPLFGANALWRVPEPPLREDAVQRQSLRESFRTVWANEPYRRLIIIFLFSTIGAAMTNSLSFFFVKHLLLAGDLYGFYLAPYFISQIVAIPAWFALSKRVGKHRATMAAIGWYALWSCFIPIIALAPAEWFTAFEIENLLTFLPPQRYDAMVSYFEGIPTGKFLFFIVVMCLKGSSIGALSALPYAMAADVVDLDEAQTGKRQAGAYFSIWLMTRKLAYALGIFIGTSAAVWFGFNSKADPFNTTNTLFALMALTCLYSIVPAVFKFVAMPLLWNYPLTEERLNAVQQSIRARGDTSDDSSEPDEPDPRGAVPAG